jgi:5-methylcytosine-specific restriction endonuclease McrA
MLRTCTRCGEEKEEGFFKKNYRKRKKDLEQIRYTSKCLSCEKKEFKEWRTINVVAYNQRYKERRWARKERAIQYKGGVCQHCGQVVHMSAFNFHHLNKEEKDMDPGLMMSCSDARLFQELDKCILLCANCHRKEHFINGY